ncbi:MAG: SAM-dependent methyltransferase [Peptoniphilaceae bacterium]
MINIIGLGATDKDGLTLEAYKTIKNGNKNYLRTKEHKAVELFEEESIDFESFDYLYERKNSFEEVYEEISEIIVKEGENANINYIVPGNPLIAESTVVKIMEKSKDYKIISGMSFIEPLLRAVKIDPSKSMLLLDGDDFNSLSIDVKCDIIITQIYNKRIAVDLKLSLSEIYGDEYEIYLVSDAGLEDEAIYKIKIHELDIIENINHQSALFIPKSNKIKNLKDSIELIEKKNSSKKSNIEDIDILLNKTIDLLYDLISLKNEGMYTYYDILELLNKKILENGFFHKNTMENQATLGYNDYSLEDGNRAFIKELNSFDGTVINIAASVIDKVNQIGFVWDDVSGSIEKIVEELEEVNQALINKEPNQIFEELGDLLFSSINLSRYLELDPEKALKYTTEKFIKRFEIMGKLASEKNMDLQAMKLNELDNLYNEAKKIEN